MIERICHIDNELEDSIFLFGARQTWKSTFCVRAYPMYLFLLVSAEISDFDLQQAINYGMLPPHYLAKTIF